MRKEKLQLIFVLLFFTALHVIPLNLINLGYDEAYYWQWSQHLAAGYFDHPPMVAVFIYLSEKIFGSSPLAIRSSILFSNILVSYILYTLAIKLSKNHKSGLIAVILFNILPIFALGQIMITPDIPQLVFVSISIYFAYVILEEKNNNVFLWIALGSALGCSLMSKYTSVIFAGVIYANILFNSKYKYLLKSYKPYLSLLFVVLVFSPNIYWNSQNNWDCFLFQFYNRHSSHVNHFSSFFGFIGLQFAITGLFLFLFIPTIYKDIKQNGATLLNSLAVAPLLVFTIISMVVKMRFYWALLSYIPMIIIYANNWPTYKKSFLNLLWFNALLITLIIAHLHAPLITLPKPQSDAYGDINGWSNVADTIDQFINKQPDPNNWVIISNDFHIAASTDYNLRGKYTVYSLPQYNKREGNYYWQNEANLTHKNALIIEDSKHSFNPEELYNCNSISAVDNIDVIYNKLLYRRYTIYKCLNFINRK